MITKNDEPFIGLNLKAAYVASHTCRLGGEPTVMLTVSLDARSTWPNGILQNSRYAKFSIDQDGTVEHFCGSLPKFRKVKAKDAEALVAKLNAWIAKVSA
jgi:hypothetical protein